MDKLQAILETQTRPQATTVQQCIDPRSKGYAQMQCNVLNSTEGKLQGYDCPKCKNRGYTYEPRENEGSHYWGFVSVQCDCMKIREEVSRRQRSGLNKLMQKYTFKTYNADEPWQREIVKNACDYVRNPDGWFFVGGQVGSGKTHICTAIVNSLISRGRAARYMIWNEEITNLKQAATDGEKYEGLIRSIQRADILYIDDFFKVAKGYGVTASDINTTFKIINYRYNEDLPTIISSELSISEIIKIDEALGSRIAEMAHGRDCYIAKDESKNYRYRAARS